MVAPKEAVCVRVFMGKSCSPRVHVINSNGKEGTANEISLSLDLINVKDGSNFWVGVSKP